jgi:hypothetical protein
MRTLLLLLILVFGVLSAFSQNVEIMDKERISKNKIKTQTLFEYDYINGKPEIKGVKSRIDSVDMKGQRLSQVNYRENGTILNLMTFKYDYKGNKTEFSKFSLDENKMKLNYKQSVKFDSKGNKTLETGYNGLDSFKNVYNYNKTGKLAEVNFFIKKKLDEKRVFSNENNNANLKILDGYGALKFTQKNVYSSSGKILEEVRFETDNTESQKIVYAYNSSDNITSETKYIKGKLFSKISYVYNNNNLLSEIYMESTDGVKYLTNKYLYNEKGWLIEDQSRDEKNKDFSKNSYTYDDNGICKTIDSFFAKYNQQVLSVFIYAYY